MRIPSGLTSFLKMSYEQRHRAVWAYRNLQYWEMCAWRDLNRHPICGVRSVRRTIRDCYGIKFISLVSRGRWMMVNNFYSEQLLKPKHENSWSVGLHRHEWNRRPYGAKHDSWHAGWKGAEKSIHDDFDLIITNREAKRKFAIRRADQTRLLPMAVSSTGKSHMKQVFAYRNPPASHWRVSAYLEAWTMSFYLKT